SGFHFKATHAHATQIEQFSIPTMANHMQRLAPECWTLLHTLLSQSSDPLGRECHVPFTLADDDMGSHGPMNDLGFDTESEAAYWSNDSENGQGNDMDEGVHPKATKWQRHAAQRGKALDQIQTVARLSILMISVNQWCNLLASINGFFCHASGAPETVINMMAHTGLSISTTSIHCATVSLSEESRKRIHELGQTFCTAWVFDNIGWHQKPADPTLENQGTHVEATTAMFIPLEHGVTAEDLHCSKALWATSPINPQPTLP
ncbi:hypothetical protein K439DRAFT_1296560, partial [Ramaria rubella]